MSPGLPLLEAAPQIMLNAGGGLVAFFRRLGEQLHDDVRDRVGDIRHVFVRRQSALER